MVPGFLFGVPTEEGRKPQLEDQQWQGFRSAADKRSLQTAAKQVEVAGARPMRGEREGCPLAETPFLLFSVRWSSAIAMRRSPTEPVRARTTRLLVCGRRRALQLAPYIAPQWTRTRVSTGVR